ncbi:hypothetical protein [Hungatella hathewayi]|uniref:hypothetical protein n=1 Tax=Hungatella hathewayi TaxID=154046 RepID=UPI003566E7B9
MGGEFLCIGNYGNIKNERTINTPIKKACSALGVPVISVHDLRHMAALLNLAYSVIGGGFKSFLTENLPQELLKKAAY